MVGAYLKSSSRREEALTFSIRNSIIEETEPRYLGCHGVKGFSHLILLLTMVFLPIGSLSARDLADYHIGDQVEEDIVAPTTLSIMDPEATQVLKQKEADKVPMVIRFYTNTADTVETHFRTAFTQTHENFLSAVEAAFGHRTLTGQEIASEKFSQLIASFQFQNTLFPVSNTRAALWAGGDSDREYLSFLASTLRKTESQPVWPDSVPINAWTGTLGRLVPGADAGEALNPTGVEQRGKDVALTSLSTLANTRRQFQSLFAPEDRPVTRYLVSLLEANCSPDEEITQQLRAKRTEGLSVADQYQAGQVIAKRGQIVDGKIKAAFDQLRDKEAVNRMQQLVAAEQAQAAQRALRMRWIIGALAGALLISLAIAWRLARRHRQTSLLPATRPGLAPASSGSFDPSDTGWRQRALAAETQAQNAQALVRSGLMPLLARWLSEKLVQRLISQRASLLDTHSKAALEMAELVERLEKIHAPLKDRLLAYERRIVELEKELAIKGEENRELIRAKIQLTRKQLEIEREKNRMDLN